MLPAGLYEFLFVANPPEKQAGDSRSRHQLELWRGSYKQQLNVNERSNPFAQHFSLNGRNCNLTFRDESELAT
jgi:hypothetical protein